jgi:hypothetical protein
MIDMPSAGKMSGKQPSSKALAMRRYREKMRAAGFRPVQIWVPDTRSPAFAAQYRRQVKKLWNSAADRADLDFIMAVQDWSE